jgi:hypothetical protein
MRGSTRTSRIAAYVASGALVVSGTVLAATPAEAAPDPIGTNQGANWLAGQVPSSGLVPGQYGGPDVGVSIDTAQALRTAGGHDDTVDKIADGIQTDGLSYIEYEYDFDSDNDGTDETYAGQAANATAKAMALFQTLDPARTTIDTINLQSRLEALTAGSGRIGDVSKKDGVDDGQDYANTLGQAFAAYALTEAGSSEAADAVSFLLEQQCANGGFRLAFTADCADSATAETDVTAIALQQLNLIPTTVQVTAAKAAARTWLINAQKDDGSWGGGASTEGSNSNSTGLAASALGDTTQSEKAAQWLRARQATHYNACDKLAGNRGAIAYDNAALTAGRNSGITKVADQDQWRRATSQALPAMEYLPEDTTPANPVLTGPSGYLKAGSTRGLTTKGVGRGDKLCVTGPGAKAQGTAAGSSKILPVTLPAGTATRTYRVWDSWGNTDTGSVKVVGKKTLPLYKTKSRVKRSGLVTVRIGRLASREGAKIWYKGKVVRSGKATTGGVFSARFKVGRSLGKKSIVGHGQYGDIRRGATTIRVVR